jgi:Anti-sigma regulatory factor (Ser/Thr protein kinase)
MADSAAPEHLVSRLSLPAMASSVATARLHTRELMERWDLPKLVDDAELVVSELVTNAIKAADMISPRARYPELYDRLTVVRLTISRSAGELRVEVWDPRPEPPAPCDAGPDAEGGRGLLLVECLSERWGISHPPGGGKTVWAVFKP